jgi:hypothetical protein
MMAVQNTTHRQPLARAWLRDTQPTEHGTWHAEAELPGQAQPAEQDSEHNTVAAVAVLYFPARHPVQLLEVPTVAAKRPALTGA